MARFGNIGYILIKFLIIVFIGIIMKQKQINNYNDAANETTICFFSDYSNYQRSLYLFTELVFDKHSRQ